MIRIKNAQNLEKKISIDVEIMHGEIIYSSSDGFIDKDDKNKQIIDASNCLIFSGATDYTFLNDDDFKQESTILKLAGIEHAVNIECTTEYVIHNNIDSSQTQNLLNILTDACAQNKTVHINAQLFNPHPMLGDDSHISIRMGINQGLACYETASLSYILELIKQVKCNTCIYNISCAESIDLIQQAKMQAHNSGFCIKCGINIHYLLLTHHDLGYFNTLNKFYPPLRSESNQKSLIHAFKNDAIDYIYSGHCMLSLEQKKQPFADAPSGASCAEIFIPLLFKLANQYNISLAHILNKAGIKADISSTYILHTQNIMIILFNPHTEYVVDEAIFKGNSKASPFLGYPLQGKIEHIIML